MKRDPRLYFDDILQAIEKIEMFMQEIALKDFRDDIKTQDAVIRNFEIIGEAVKNIPAEIKSKFPEVAWRSAGDMRDFLIHEYPDVIVDIVWGAIKEDLPLLRKQIIHITRLEEF